ncbi:MAG: PCMD domain-containing protein [Muribaculaceae bacterium]|nr:PCMD domain-containing protein [Muribaculaceae bacterium]
MKKFINNIFRLPTLAGILLLMMTSCLSDADIPYPHIRANILQFEVEGRTRAAAIDTTAGVVTVFLDESVNIEAVKLQKFAATPGTTVSDTTLLCEPMNLADTMRLTLRIYQDYLWKIAARQTITRSFAVRGQVGQSEIDPVNHTVTADLASGHSLRSVQVTDIKLGGTTATMSPDLHNKTVDFTEPVKVNVTEFGRTTTWTITVTTTHNLVNISTIDAWTQVAWVNVDVQEGRPVSLEYRVKGSSTWSSVPQEWVESLGAGSYTARIIHLRPMTQYEVRVVSGDETSNVEEFTTGTTFQAPNNDFTNWWKDGKVWCPWTEGGEPFWGTGNRGASTLGESNSTPLTDSESATGYAGASLLTKFVGIGILGKLAAGNLFAGTYVRTDGTNGVLSFGRPCTARPTAMRATVKYNSTEISHANSEFGFMKGRPDTCVVWAALIDSPEPVEIRTKPSDRKLFDEHADYVVAYGRYQYSGVMDDYITVDIPLDYRATDRVPTYILMVCSASKYGDYFTGGAGSMLLIKKLELLYDYEN